MSALITGGTNSIIVSVPTPYESDGKTIRDDLSGIKVWYATGSGFTPPAAGTLAYNGSGLTVTIPGLDPTVTYFVRYSLISDIDPDILDLSSEYTVTPLSSTAQTVDISGFTGFAQNAGGVISPATAALTAVITNINSPVYSWTITGATPTTATTASVTITPNNGTTTVTARLSISGSNTVTPLVKTISMPMVYNGAAGQAGANGAMSAFPSIYIWTSTSTPPTRPVTTSTYTWATGAYTPPTGWSTVAPTNTTPGSYLWQLTFPLASVSATTTTSTLDWTITTNAIRSIAYNGTNGSSGTSGNSVYTATIYQQSATQPSTPVATASTFNFSTNTLTPPSGWSATQPTTTTIPTYACIYTFTGAANSIVTGTGSWSTPVIVAVAGTSGTSGNSVYSATVYQQSATQPSTPTAGTFNFNTSTLTAPTGWSKTQPSASTTPTYACVYTFTGLPNATVTAGTWSTPVIVSQNGASGNSVYSATIYQQTTTTLIAPTGGTFNFSTNTLNPPSGWSTTQPAVSIIPTYACVYTFTGAANSTVTAGTWAAPVIVAQAGFDGAPGNGVYLATIYQQLPFPPGVFNGGSFNFYSNSLTGITNGWSITPPNTSQVPTYACTYLFTGGPNVTVTAGTWSQPFIYAVAGANGANGANGTNGTNGSATFVVVRTANDSSAPTNPETISVIGRAPVAGDIATVNYNAGNNSTIYKYTTAWALTTTYLTGDLIVAGTITGSKLATNTVTATNIDTRGLSIKAADGTVILSAGSTSTNTTGALVDSVNSSISTVQSTANSAATNAATAQSTANTAVTTAVSAQSTANTAVTNAAVAQSTANTATTTANTGITNAAAAQSTANTAITNAAAAQSVATAAATAAADRLSKSTASVLSATVSINSTAGAGFVAGNLTWDAAGARTGGSGVAMTPAGLVGYNTSGTNTFTIDASTGAATFGGTLTATAVNAVNTINIAGNSVTTTKASMNFVAASLPASASTTVLVHTVGSTGTQTIINLYLEYMPAYSSGSGNALSTNIIINYNGATLWSSFRDEFTHKLTSLGIGTNYTTLTFLHTPTAGNNTYSVILQTGSPSTGSVAGQFNNGIITTLETKR